MPRDVLEAARTDGATEWQTFRRVTVPLLAPVLSVVFITMIINVLKVFDIVLALAPESTQSNANVIALAMWRTAFGGAERLRHRLGDRRLPVPARDPGARPEHPTLQEGDRRWPPQHLRCRASRARTTARRRRILRWIAKAPVHLVLARARRALARADVRALHHLDPPAVRARVERLVEDLLEAERRHVVELRRDVPQPRADHRAQDDRVHRRRQHADRGHHRRARRLRARLARVPGPRLGLHRRRSPCSSCRCRWR